MPAQHRNRSEARGRLLRVRANTFAITPSSGLIELAFRTPRYGICDPTIDVRFMPASTVGADLELSRERPLGDLAVDGGPGQPGPGENGFQTDDTVWFSDGRAASCWLFLTAADPDRKVRCGRTREFFASSCCGVQTAENRMDQISRPRRLPRSMPREKARSRPSRRPDSKVMPSSRLRFSRRDSSWGSRSRPLAMSPIAERVAL
jgi:hypothetical protein